MSRHTTLTEFLFISDDLFDDCMISNSRSAFWGHKITVFPLATLFLTNWMFHAGAK